MRLDANQSRLVASLLSILLRYDRRIRVAGPPADRQEAGIDRLHDYLRGIGREAFELGGETALWALLRKSIDLLPTQREEAMLRLVRLWAPSSGWLKDRDIPAPIKPERYRLPAA
jgi:hypothetical protein